MRSLLLFLLLVATPAHAELLCDRNGCIDAVQHDDGVDLYAVNRGRHATMSFALTYETENLAPRINDRVRTVEPGDRVLMQRLRTVDGDQWRYEYEFRYKPGRLEARHDDSIEYALPLASGTTVRVAQSCNGSYSHNGARANAIDLPLAIGTPIHAARSGTVVYTRADSDRGGPSRAFYDDANEVTIEHGDGTLAMYSHLRKDGVAVAVGDRVLRGELLGHSGNTGWSSGPHLHFEVYTIDRELEVRSVPITFRVGERTLRCPAPDTLLVAD